MKNNIAILILIILILSVWSKKINAQATSIGNSYTGGEFVGYATTIPIDFGFGTYASYTSLMSLNSNGDLNLVNGIGGYQGYQMSGVNVLWYGKDASSIFVGNNVGYKQRNLLLLTYR